MANFFFLFHFFFFGRRILSIFEKKKESPVAPFLVTRLLNRKQNFCLVWPDRGVSSAPCPVAQSGFSLTHYMFNVLRRLRRGTNYLMEFGNNNYDLTKRKCFKSKQTCWPIRYCPWPTVSVDVYWGKECVYGGGGGGDPAP